MLMMGLPSVSELQLCVVDGRKVNVELITGKVRDATAKVTLVSPHTSPQGHGLITWIDQ